mmetsp:Transcript_11879/g.18348  ORF Transcript_11879/g.18348 Transcript_11879/m.18348 type:complete len:97 (+) Transcript_11879:1632-1922(+)
MIQKIIKNQEELAWKLRAIKLKPPSRRGSQEGGLNPIVGTGEVLTTEANLITATHSNLGLDVPLLNSGELKMFGLNNPSQYERSIFGQIIKEEEEE